MSFIVNLLLKSFIDVEKLYLKPVHVAPAECRQLSFNLAIRHFTANPCRPRKLWV